jgi:deoxycytidine triphosphate deaminase/addiction module HigA family antidote
MSADLRGNATADLKAAGELTPGEHLRAEIERLGLDQVAVSQATGVSRQSINNIVNGRQPVSRAMAGKLGRLTGHSSDYWLRASFPQRPSVSAARLKSGGAALGKARPLGVGVLVNHQIVRAVKDGIIGIEPFDESHVRMASLDLTLDDFVIVADGEKIDISDGQSFVLKGGRTVNVGTKEWIEFPQDYIGRVGAMSSLAKLGIMTSHGFQIDPGFKGNLQFCLFNAWAKDFELRGGDPIVSVEIMPLSATPAYDEGAAMRGSHARDDKVISLFRNDICDRLIRDAIRGRTQVDVGNDGAKAKISDLNIEILDAAPEAALDGAVHGALSGLKTLREKPNAARDDCEKYAAFFGNIAERLYLTSEQTSRALACLGLPIDSSDTLLAALRDGGEAIVPLPTKSAKVSLSHLARQLHEDPLDLTLMLVGAKPYTAMK